MKQAKRAMSKSKEYVAYHSAKQRCTNPNKVTYKYYGGRGIKFLLPPFAEFLAAIGPCPQDMELDRIDNDGNYEISNVRWATRKQQIHNRRSWASPVTCGALYRQTRSRFWWFSCYVNGKRVRRSTGVPAEQPGHSLSIMDPSESEIATETKGLELFSNFRMNDLWCREGESNPHRAFAPADFKSAASANFAIPAFETF